MARLELTGVGSTHGGTTVTLTAAGTTATWSSNPGFPTIAAPDYLAVKVESEIIYITAHTVGALSSTVVRNAEPVQNGSGAVAHTNSAWSHSSLPGDGAWTVIGATGAPAFQNSWAAGGTPTAPPQFRRLSGGLIVVEGLAITGAGGTTAFTLPTHYQPAHTLLLPTIAGAGAGPPTVAATAGAGYGSMFTYPAGILAGDILMVILTADSLNNPLGTISGYSQLTSWGIGGPNPAGGSGIFYKTADGTEGGTAAPTPSNSNTLKSLAVVRGAVSGPTYIGLSTGSGGTTTVAASAVSQAALQLIALTGQGNGQTFSISGGGWALQAGSYENRWTPQQEWASNSYAAASAGQAATCVENSPSGVEPYCALATFLGQPTPTSSYTTIDSSGNVVPAAGGAVGMVLDGIRFFAEA